MTSHVRIATTPLPFVIRMRQLLKAKWLGVGPLTSGSLAGKANLISASLEIKEGKPVLRYTCSTSFSSTFQPFETGANDYVAAVAELPLGTDQLEIAPVCKGDFFLSPNESDEVYLLIKDGTVTQLIAKDKTGFLAALLALADATGTAKDFGIEIATAGTFAQQTCAACWNFLVDVQTNAGPIVSQLAKSCLPDGTLTLPALLPFFMPGFSAKSAITVGTWLKAEQWLIGTLNVDFPKSTLLPVDVGSKAANYQHLVTQFVASTLSSKPHLSSSVGLNTLPADVFPWAPATLVELSCATMSCLGCQGLRAAQGDDPEASVKANKVVQSLITFDAPDSKGFSLHFERLAEGNVIDGILDAKVLKFRVASEEFGPSGLAVKGVDGQPVFLEVQFVGTLSFGGFNIKWNAEHPASISMSASELVELGDSELAKQFIGSDTGNKIITDRMNEIRGLLGAATAMQLQHARDSLLSTIGVHGASKQSAPWNSRFDLAFSATMGSFVGSLELPFEAAADKQIVPSPAKFEASTLYEEDYLITTTPESWAVFEWILWKGRCLQGILMSPVGSWIQNSGKAASLSVKIVGASASLFQSSVNAKTGEVTVSRVVPLGSVVESFDKLLVKYPYVVAQASGWEKKYVADAKENPGEMLTRAFYHSGAAQKYFEPHEPLTIEISVNHGNFLSFESVASAQLELLATAKLVDPLALAFALWKQLVVTAGTVADRSPWTSSAGTQKLTVATDESVQLLVAKPPVGTLF